MYILFFILMHIFYGEIISVQCFKHVRRFGLDLQYMERVLDIEEYITVLSHDVHVHLDTDTDTVHTRTRTHVTSPSF